MVDVLPYSAEWPRQFDRIVADLLPALAHVPKVNIEHVGSTSVPGLAAKPVLDIDVIVAESDIRAAVSALESIGYVHLGDLGIPGREAFRAPDDDPRRHVYVCVAGSLSVRNHLAVRTVLRERADLRAEYAAVKLALAAQPGMDIDTYAARKSRVLTRILEVAGLTEDERRQILAANDPDGGADPGPYFHGTKADLVVGDRIEAGRSSNFGGRQVARFVYLTATLDAAVWGAELAQGEGPGRIYVVEPTGPIEDDPNLTNTRFRGNPTRSYRTREPLVVVGEVGDWVGHPPEVLQAMRDRLAELAQQGVEAINE